MKLIDKDAVAAEVENLLDKGRHIDAYHCAYRDGNNGALYALKDKLNTIKVIEVGVDFADPKGDKSAKCIIDTKTHEVKEIDLEKELDSMITPELKLHKALPSLFDVAKHFFEFGLKIQKGE